MHALVTVRQVWRLAGPVMALGVIAAAAVAGLVWQSRETAIRDGEARVESLATIFAEQVGDAVHTVDVSLENVVKLAAADDEDAFVRHVKSDSFRNMLLAEAKAVPNVNSLVVTNAAGEAIVGAMPAPPGYSIASRPYFQDLRAKSGAGLVVSGLLLGVISHKLTQVFARRIEGRDRQFLGVVYYSIPPQNLLRQHTAITQGTGLSLALFTADGALLVREPAIPGLVGTKPPLRAAWWDLSRKGGGVFHAEPFFDRYWRYAAVKPVPDFPLVATVTISDDAVLGEWRRNALVLGVVSALVIALVGALMIGRAALNARLNIASRRAKLRGRWLHASRKQTRKVAELFAETLDRMEFGVTVFDAETRLMVCNRYYMEIYGLRPEQMPPGTLGRDVLEIRLACGAYSPETVAQLRAGRQLRLTGPRIERLANGRVIEARSEPTREGGYCDINRDITDSVRHQEQLAAMALQDALTGLANRAAFLRRMDELVERDGASSPALLLIDLHRFRDVNDVHGHFVGDAALVEVARRLSAACNGSFVARLGGDEFVALARPGETEGGPLALAAALLGEIGRPIDVRGGRIGLGASIGVTAVVPGADKSTAALRRADLALQEAKRRGPNVIVPYEEELLQRFLARTELANELRAAIERQEIEVFYQPIVDAHDQRVVAREALARWRHPLRGWVSPGVFIPLAEESGLIESLDDLVFRRACGDAAAWPDEIIVSVNVSPIEFSQADLVDRLSAALATTKLAPRRLQIEITESAILRNENSTRVAMRRLRDLGASLALDDFGVGFASLAYLKSFKFDRLKIDRSFVIDISDNPQSIAIVMAVVALARTLDIAVTAEGVETIEQFERLRSAGVMSIQGYLFGRPAPNPSAGAAQDGPAPMAAGA